MIAWIGTITSVIGSFLVAFGILQLGYIAFLIGSASWIYVAITKSDKALLTLNMVFFIANIIGFTRTI